MKTFSAKAHETKHNWYLIDATDRILGRLATEVSKRLRGKHKPEYTPHVDTGDYVIIINAEKVKVTGNKFNNKIYYHHTGYPGGLKSNNFAKLQQTNPLKILELAIKGMLPRNSLGRKMFTKLKVYVGSEHPHIAQQPQQLSLLNDN